jgi:hypothetical protein
MIDAVEFDHSSSGLFRLGRICGLLSVVSDLFGNWESEVFSRQLYFSMLYAICSLPFALCPVPFAFNFFFCKILHKRLTKENLHDILSAGEKM